MNRRTKIRVFYAGWDAKTLIYLLNDSRIQVIGVAKIETLSECGCWLPDVLLAIGYRLYALNPRLRITALVSLLQRLCSDRWQRYIEYFDRVLRNRIPIVGMESAQATTNWLNDNNADLLLINVGNLIPEQVYKAPKFGSINIHPSELPRHRGALPTLWTLKNADTTSAVTYHLLDRKADAGDILKQIQFDVSSYDTWEKLEEKIDAIVRKTLVETIVEWVDGRAVPRKQDPARATKTAKFDDYREIDLGEESAKEITTKIQYYAHWTPSTPCYFRFGRLTASVFDARISDSSDDSASSTLGKIWRRGVRLVLQTKAGKLIVYPLTGMSAAACGYLMVKYLKQTISQQFGGDRTPVARISELALGHVVNWSSGYAFDYALYPFVIWKLGFTKGGATMALLSLLICLLILWFYDWSKRDWLGIEAVKRLREYQGESRFRKWTATILRRGDWAALILLSLKFDSFITTIYLRQSSFDGMSKRDWRNFFLSWIIGNLYWALACFGGVSALAWLWRKLS